LPVPELDDGQLLVQIRRGDLRAFEALYDKYKGRVFRTALAITRDRGAAEDILQDCFLRLHANVDRLDGSTPIAPWLYRVTVNLSYNWLTKHRHQVASWEDVVDRFRAKSAGAPERLAEGAELRQTVRRAIDSLDFTHRVVVTLFYLGEFSLEEIAYIMDCPVGTVKSRLHYARQKLRRQLLREGAEGAASAEVQYEFT